MGGLRLFCLDMNVGCDIVCSDLGEGTMVCSWKCCISVMNVR